MPNDASEILHAQLNHSRHLVHVETVFLMRPFIENS